MQTYPFKLFRRIFQVQQERDELYRKFVKAIHEVLQKSNFKNLLLEKKLNALADTLEKKEAQLTKYFPHQIWTHGPYSCHKKTTYVETNESSKTIDTVLYMPLELFEKCKFLQQTLGLFGYF